MEHDEERSVSLGTELSASVPPPSPLTGCYLLAVLGEPHTQQHKEIILQRLVKGLLSWDSGEHQVDLEKELATLTAAAPEGEEARYGERLIQFASENLVTEILIHPQMNTLMQCMRNLLSSFTRHRHLIHAGYTFSGNGSWIMQDGTFSLADFIDAFQENEVQRVVRAYEGSISIDVHCAPGVGEWAKLPAVPCLKHCRVRVNPTDILDSGSQPIKDFTSYLEPYVVPASLEQLLVSSDVVGNIRFSHPTLYVFPGGQGDAALFGINGFNMLVDGGFSRKACWWDFARHLDRLDAVLLTRLNNCSAAGMAAVLRRKASASVYPQIGHFFCNLEERRSLASPDGAKDEDPLSVSLIQEGSDMMADLRHINLKPQHCYRGPDPINLYHKVGHGTLDMYVLNPSKDSKYVREFLKKWHNSEQKLFENSSVTGQYNFPIPNLVSICALLVWRPANPDDTITRIMFPGSTPQHKIFEGLDKLKHLEFLQNPTCTGRQMAPMTPHVPSTVSVSARSTRHTTSKISKERSVITDKTRDERIMEPVKRNIEVETDSKNIIDNKLLNELVDGEDNKIETVLQEALTSRIDTKIENKISDIDKVISDSLSAKPKDYKKKDKIITEKKPKSVDKTEETKDLSKATEIKKTDVDGKLKTEQRKITESRNKSEKITTMSRTKVSQRAHQKSSEKKTTPASLDKKVVADDKKSPPATPKKYIDTIKLGPKDSISQSLTKEKMKTKTRRLSPSSTPGKSVKEANNRRVVESKYKQISPKRETIQKSHDKKESKPKREPISRRPRPLASPVKGLKSLKSPSKSIKSERLKSENSKLKGLQRVNYEDILKDAKKSDEDTSKSLDDIKQQELDEKEEQEIVREIEAVFNRDSEIDEKMEFIGRSDIEKITCLLGKPKSTTIVDEEFEEEYLIIEKEEVDHLTDSTADHESSHKEDELQKHLRDKEESEKNKEQPISSLEKNDTGNDFKTDDVQIDKKQESKEPSISIEEKHEMSSEKKTSDSKSSVIIPKDSLDLNNVQESQPDEKISATIESGATTAPTLPEDERIPLNDIKIIEKIDETDTKENILPHVVSEIPKPNSIKKIEHLPAPVREIVKTPDEVADLPLHEEVDYQTYDDQKKISVDDDVFKRKPDVGFVHEIKIPKDLPLTTKDYTGVKAIQDDIVIKTVECPSHAEIVTVTPGSAPESPLYPGQGKELSIQKQGLEPVKEFDDGEYNYAQFTEKLRETHITTVDSPIKEGIITIEDIHRLPDKIPSIPEDIEKELEESRKNDLGEKPLRSPLEVEKIVADVAEVLKSDKSLDELIAEKSPQESIETFQILENILDDTGSAPFTTNTKTVESNDIVKKEFGVADIPHKEISPVRSVTSEEMSDVSDKTVLSETKKITKRDIKEDLEFHKDVTVPYIIEQQKPLDAQPKLVEKKDNKTDVDITGSSVKDMPLMSIEEKHYHENGVTKIALLEPVETQKETTKKQLLDLHSEIDNVISDASHSEHDYKKKENICKTSEFEPEKENNFETDQKDAVLSNKMTINEITFARNSMLLDVMNFIDREKTHSQLVTSEQSTTSFKKQLPDSGGEQLENESSEIKDNKYDETSLEFTNKTKSKNTLSEDIKTPETVVEDIEDKDVGTEKIPFSETFNSKTDNLVKGATVKGPKKPILQEQHHEKTSHVNVEKIQNNLKEESTSTISDKDIDSTEERINVLRVGDALMDSDELAEQHIKLKTHQVTGEKKPFDDSSKQVKEVVIEEGESVTTISEKVLEPKTTALTTTETENLASDSLKPVEEVVERKVKTPLDFDAQQINKTVALTKDMPIDGDKVKPVDRAVIERSEPVSTKSEAVLISKMTATTTTSTKESDELVEIYIKPKSDQVTDEKVVSEKNYKPSAEKKESTITTPDKDIDSKMEIDLTRVEQTPTDAEKLIEKQVTHHVTEEKIASDTVMKPTDKLVLEKVESMTTISDEVLKSKVAPIITQPKDLRIDNSKSIENIAESKETTTLDSDQETIDTTSAEEKDTSDKDIDSKKDKRDPARVEDTPTDTEKLVNEHVSPKIDHVFKESKEKAPIDLNLKQIDKALAEKKSPDKDIDPKKSMIDVTRSEYLLIDDDKLLEEHIRPKSDDVHEKILPSVTATSNLKTTALTVDLPIDSSKLVDAVFERKEKTTLYSDLKEIEKITAEKKEYVSDRDIDSKADKKDLKKSSAEGNESAITKPVADYKEDKIDVKPIEDTSNGSEKLTEEYVRPKSDHVTEKKIAFGVGIKPVDKPMTEQGESVTTISDEALEPKITAISAEKNESGATTPDKDIDSKEDKRDVMRVEDTQTYSEKLVDEQQIDKTMSKDTEFTSTTPDKHTDSDEDNIDQTLVKITPTDAKQTVDDHITPKSEHITEEKIQFEAVTQPVIDEGEPLTATSDEVIESKTSAIPITPIKDLSMDNSKSVQEADKINEKSPLDSELKVIDKTLAEKKVLAVTTPEKPIDSEEKNIDLTRVEDTLSDAEKLVDEHITSKSDHITEEKLSVGAATQLVDKLMVDEGEPVAAISDQVLKPKTSAIPITPTKDLPMDSSKSVAHVVKSNEKSPLDSNMKEIDKTLAEKKESAVTTLDKPIDSEEEKIALTTVEDTLTDADKLVDKHVTPKSDYVTEEKISVGAATPPVDKPMVDKSEPVTAISNEVSKPKTSAIPITPTKDLPMDKSVQEVGKSNEKSPLDSDLKEIDKILAEAPFEVGTQSVDKPVVDEGKSVTATSDKVLEPKTSALTISPTKDLTMDNSKSVQEAVKSNEKSPLDSDLKEIDKTLAEKKEPVVTTLDKPIDSEEKKIDLTRIEDTLTDAEKIVDEHITSKSDHITEEKMPVGAATQLVDKPMVDEGEPVTAISDQVLKPKTSAIPITPTKDLPKDSSKSVAHVKSNEKSSLDCNMKVIDKTLAEKKESAVTALDKSIYSGEKKKDLTKVEDTLTDADKLVDEHVTLKNDHVTEEEIPFDSVKQLVAKPVIAEGERVTAISDEVLKPKTTAISITPTKDLPIDSSKTVEEVVKSSEISPLDSDLKEINKILAEKKEPAITTPDKPIDSEEEQKDLTRVKDVIPLESVKQLDKPVVDEGERVTAISDEVLKHETTAISITPTKDLPIDSSKTVEEVVKSNEKSPLYSDSKEIDTTLAEKKKSAITTPDTLIDSEEEKTDLTRVEDTLTDVEKLGDEHVTPMSDYITEEKISVGAATQLDDKLVVEEDVLVTAISDPILKPETSTTPITPTKDILMDNSKSVQESNVKASLHSDLKEIDKTLAEKREPAVTTPDKPDSEEENPDLSLVEDTLTHDEKLIDEHVTPKTDHVTEEETPLESVKQSVDKPVVDEGERLTAISVEVLTPKTTAISITLTKDLPMDSCKTAEEVVQSNEKAPLDSDSKEIDETLVEKKESAITTPDKLVDSEEEKTELTRVEDTLTDAEKLGDEHVTHKSDHVTEVKISVGAATQLVDKSVVDEGGPVTAISDPILKPETSTTPITPTKDMLMDTSKSVQEVDKSNEKASFDSDLKAIDKILAEKKESAITTPDTLIDSKEKKTDLTKVKDMLTNTEKLVDQHFTPKSDHVTEEEIPCESVKQLDKPVVDEGERVTAISYEVLKPKTTAISVTPTKDLPIDSSKTIEEVVKSNEKSPLDSDSKEIYKILAEKESAIAKPDKLIDSEETDLTRVEDTLTDAEKLVDEHVTPKSDHITEQAVRLEGVTQPVDKSMVDESEPVTEMSDEALESKTNAVPIISTIVEKVVKSNERSPLDSDLKEIDRTPLDSEQDKTDLTRVKDTLTDAEKLVDEHITLKIDHVTEEQISVEAYTQPVDKPVVDEVEPVIEKSDEVLEPKITAIPTTLTKDLPMDSFKSFEEVVKSNESSPFDTDLKEIDRTLAEKKESVVTTPDKPIDSEEEKIDLTRFEDLLIDTEKLVNEYVTPKSDHVTEEEIPFDSVKQLVDKPDEGERVTAISDEVLKLKTTAISITPTKDLPIDSSKTVEEVVKSNEKSPLDSDSKEIDKSLAEKKESAITTPDTLIDSEEDKTDLTRVEDTLTDAEKLVDKHITSKSDNITEVKIPVGAATQPVDKSVVDEGQPVTAKSDQVLESKTTAIPITPTKDLTMDNSKTAEEVVQSNEKLLIDSDSKENDKTLLEKKESAITTPDKLIDSEEEKIDLTRVEDKLINAEKLVYEQVTPKGDHVTEQAVPLERVTQPVDKSMVDEGEPVTEISDEVLEPKTTAMPITPTIDLPMDNLKYVEEVVKSNERLPLDSDLIEIDKSLAEKKEPAILKPHTPLNSEQDKTDPTRVEDTLTDAEKLVDEHVTSRGDYVTEQAVPLEVVTQPVDKSMVVECEPVTSNGALEPKISAILITPKKDLPMDSSKSIQEVVKSNEKSPVDSDLNEVDKTLAEEKESAVATPEKSIDSEEEKTDIKRIADTLTDTEKLVDEHVTPKSDHVTEEKISVRAHTQPVDKPVVDEGAPVTAISDPILKPETSTTPITPTKDMLMDTSKSVQEVDKNNEKAPFDSDLKEIDKTLAEKKESAITTPDKLIDSKEEKTDLIRVKDMLTDTEKLVDEHVTPKSDHVTKEEIPFESVQQLDKPVVDEGERVTAISDEILKPKTTAISITPTKDLPIDSSKTVEEVVKSNEKSPLDSDSKEIDKTLADKKESAITTPDTLIDSEEEKTDRTRVEVTLTNAEKLVDEHVTSKSDHVTERAVPLGGVKQQADKSMVVESEPVTAISDGALEPKTSAIHITPSKDLPTDSSKSVQEVVKCNEKSPLDSDLKEIDKTLAEKKESTVATPDKPIDSEEEKTDLTRVKDMLTDTEKLVDEHVTPKSDHVTKEEIPFEFVKQLDKPVVDEGERVTAISDEILKPKTTAISITPTKDLPIDSSKTVEEVVKSNEKSPLDSDSKEIDKTLADKKESAITTPDTLIDSEEEKTERTRVEDTLTDAEKIVDEHVTSKSDHVTERAVPLEGIKQQVDKSMVVESEPVTAILDGALEPKTSAIHITPSKDLPTDSPKSVQEVVKSNEISPLDSDLKEIDKTLAEKKESTVATPDKPIDSEEEKTDLTRLENTLIDAEKLVVEHATPKNDLVTEEKIPVETATQSVDKLIVDECELVTAILDEVLQSKTSITPTKDLMMDSSKSVEEIVKSDEKLPLDPDLKEIDKTLTEKKEPAITIPEKFIESEEEKTELRRIEDMPTDAEKLVVEHVTPKYDYVTEEKISVGTATQSVDKLIVDEDEPVTTIMDEVLQSGTIVVSITPTKDLIMDSSKSVDKAIKSDEKSPLDPDPKKIDETLAEKKEPSITTQNKPIDSKQEKTDFTQVEGTLTDDEKLVVEHVTPKNDYVTEEKMPVGTATQLVDKLIVDEDEPVTTISDEVLQSETITVLTTPAIDLPIDSSKFVEEVIKSDEKSSLDPVLNKIDQTIEEKKEPTITTQDKPIDSEQQKTELTQVEGTLTDDEKLVDGHVTSKSDHVTEEAVPLEAVTQPVVKSMIDEVEPVIEISDEVLKPKTTAIPITQTKDLIMDSSKSVEVVAESNEKSPLDSDLKKIDKSPAAKQQSVITTQDKLIDSEEENTDLTQVEDTLTDAEKFVDEQIILKSDHITEEKIPIGAVTQPVDKPVVDDGISDEVLEHKNTAIHIIPTKDLIIDSSKSAEKVVKSNDELSLDSDLKKIDKTLAEKKEPAITTQYKPIDSEEEKTDLTLVKVTLTDTEKLVDEQVTPKSDHLTEEKIPVGTITQPVDKRDEVARVTIISDDVLEPKTSAILIEPTKNLMMDISKSIEDVVKSSEKSPLDSDLKEIDKKLAVKNESAISTTDKSLNFKEDKKNLTLVEDAPIDIKKLVDEQRDHVIEEHVTFGPEINLVVKAVEEEDESVAAISDEVSAITITQNKDLTIDSSKSVEDVVRKSKEKLPLDVDLKIDLKIDKTSGKKTESISTTLDKDRDSKEDKINLKEVEYTLIDTEKLVVEHVASKSDHVSEEKITFDAIIKPVDHPVVDEGEFITAILDEACEPKITTTPNKYLIESAPEKILQSEINKISTPSEDNVTNIIKPVEQSNDKTNVNDKESTISLSDKYLDSKDDKKDTTPIESHATEIESNVLVTKTIEHVPVSKPIVEPMIEEFVSAVITSETVLEPKICVSMIAPTKDVPIYSVQSVGKDVEPKKKTTTDPDVQQIDKTVAEDKETSTIAPDKKQKIIETVQIESDKLSERNIHVTQEHLSFDTITKPIDKPVVKENVSLSVSKSNIIANTTSTNDLSRDSFTDEDKIEEKSLLRTDVIPDEKYLLHDKESGTTQVTLDSESHTPTLMLVKAIPAKLDLIEENEQTTRLPLVSDIALEETIKHKLSKKEEIFIKEATTHSLTHGSSSEDVSKEISLEEKHSFESTEKDLVNHESTKEERHYDGEEVRTTSLNSIRTNSFKSEDLDSLSSQNITLLKTTFDNSEEFIRKPEFQITKPSTTDDVKYFKEESPPTETFDSGVHSILADSEQNILSAEGRSDEQSLITEDAFSILEKIQKAFSSDEYVQQGIKSEDIESAIIHSELDRVSTPPTVPVSPLPKTPISFHDVRINEGVQSEITYDKCDGAEDIVTKIVYVGDDVLTQRISTSTEKMPKVIKKLTTDTEGEELKTLMQTVGKIRTETDTVTKVIKEGENVVTQTITTVTTKEIISREDGTPQNIKTTIETTTLSKSADGSTTTCKDTQTLLTECSSSLKSTSNMELYSKENKVQELVEDVGEKFEKSDIKDNNLKCVTDQEFHTKNKEQLDKVSYLTSEYVTFDSSDENIEDTTIDTDVRKKIIKENGIDIIETVTTVTKKETIRENETKKTIKTTIETETMRERPDGSKDIQRNVEVKTEEHLEDSTDNIDDILNGLEIFDEPEESESIEIKEIELQDIFIQREIVTRVSKLKYYNSHGVLKKLKTTTTITTTDNYPDGSSQTKIETSIAVSDVINDDMLQMDDLSDFTLVEDKSVVTDTQEKSINICGKDILQKVTVITTTELLASTKFIEKKLRTTTETITETKMPDGIIEVTKDIKISVSDYEHESDTDKLEGYDVVGEPEIDTITNTEIINESGTIIHRTTKVVTTKLTLKNITNNLTKLKTIVKTVIQDEYPDGSIASKSSEKISILDMSLKSPEQLSENIESDKSYFDDNETVDDTTVETDIKDEIIEQGSIVIKRTITTKTKRDTLTSCNKNIKRIRTTIETTTVDEYPDGSTETTKDVKITISEFQKTSDSDLQAALEGLTSTGKVKKSMDTTKNIMVDNGEKITQNITIYVTKEELQNFESGEIAVKTVTETVTENTRENGTSETTKDVRTQITYLPKATGLDDWSPEELNEIEKQSVNERKPTIEELPLHKLAESAESNKVQSVKNKQKSPIGEVTEDTETYTKVIKEGEHEVTQTITVVTTREVISPEKIKITVETTTVSKGNDGITKTTKSTKTTISECKEEFEETIDTGESEKSFSKCSTKTCDLQSSSAASDDLDQQGISSPPSDSSGHGSRAATHVWATESSGMCYSDDEGPESPSSTKSQVAQSPRSNLSFELEPTKSSQQKSDKQDDHTVHVKDLMSTSVYEHLPDDSCSPTTHSDTKAEMQIKDKPLSLVTDEFLTQEKGHFLTQSDATFFKEADEHFEKAIEEHKRVSGPEVISNITAKYELHEQSGTSSSQDSRESKEESKITLKDIKSDTKRHSETTSSTSTSSTSSSTSKFESKKQDIKYTKMDQSKDPIESWGKPLGLPSPMQPTTQTDGKSTPKKQAQSSTILSKNKINQDKAKDSKSKASESPSKKKSSSPVYLELTYVPHHGNSYYSAIEFFKRVRARYYVFSGTEPSKDIYNALLDAKKTWEDKDLEVTIIPTYDTDVLGYWVTENEEALEKYKIDLSPSASRCTINLQDHETSCAAYRLEF